MARKKRGRPKAVVRIQPSRQVLYRFQGWMHELYVYWGPRI